MSARCVAASDEDRSPAPIGLHNGEGGRDAGVARVIDQPHIAKVACGWITAGLFINVRQKFKAQSCPFHATGTSSTDSADAVRFPLPPRSM